MVLNQNKVSSTDYKILYQQLKCKLKQFNLLTNSFIIQLKQEAIYNAIDINNATWKLKSRYKFESSKVYFKNFLEYDNILVIFNLQLIVLS